MFKVSFIQPVKIVRPEFTIGQFLGNNVINDFDNCMGNRYRRFFNSTPVGLFGDKGRSDKCYCFEICQRSFDQIPFQPLVSLTGLAALALPRTLVIPRTKSCPGSQMAVRRKTAHIHANLSHYRLCHFLVHSRNGIQKGYLLKKRGNPSPLSPCSNAQLPHPDSPDGRVSAPA